MLTILWKEGLGNILGEGENADSQAFLSFPNCFLPSKKNQIFKMHRSATGFNLDKCKNLLSINSVPNNKILTLTILKGFADDKINVTQKLKFVLGRVENIVGKGENAGNQFSPFPTLFSKGFLYRVVKSQDCVVKG